MTCRLGFPAVRGDDRHWNSARWTTVDTRNCVNGDRDLERRLIRGRSMEVEISIFM